LDNGGKRNVSAIFERFPYYKAHFSYCAGQPTDVISETAWAVFIVSGAGKSQAADQIALQWFMVHCLPTHAGAIATAAAMRWQHNFKNNYPSGIGAVMAKMFKSGHPLITYAPPMESYDFHGLEGILAGLTQLLLSEGVAVLNTLLVDAEAAAKAALALGKEAEEAARAEIARLAAGARRRLEVLATRADAEAKKVAHEVHEAEMKAGHAAVTVVHKAVDGINKGAKETVAELKHVEAVVQKPVLKVTQATAKVVAKPVAPIANEAKKVCKKFLHCHK
jgi:hypothetical protein